MKPSGLNAGTEQTSYSTRPSFKDKFCPIKARQIIKERVESLLQDQKYQKQGGQGNHTQDVAEEVRSALKDEFQGRYKIMVQVAVGERLGQGVRMGSKCFWDSDTDNLATYSYMNDHLFCVVVAYACYIY
mmetsp:Transcript_2514/g.3946  ORF Transcript_2514/g.3946 Transcript_2514/m.3946 type:complete len:130 (+) Transcript_2514:52-441(+)